MYLKPTPSQNHYLRTSIALLLAFALTFYAYASSIAEIIRRWNTEEEYGHGPLLVVIALYFILVKWHTFNILPAKKRAWGATLVLCATVMLFAGELSSLYILMHYALLLTLAGILVATFGVNAIRLMAPAFVILIFAVPLPYFLQTILTINLQLVSSMIGVIIINAFSIPVFLEGNVIDLGVMKLQVVEACAGLRYLFSLLSLGFISAYLFQGEPWKRITIFFSTIPITIAMNSFRIAVTGILVHYAGIEMAEGFIHTFQGLIIFSICLALLFLEMWLLSKIGKTRGIAFGELFGVDFVFPKLFLERQTPVGSPLITCIIIVFLAGIIENRIAYRTEIIPERTAFAHFPKNIAEWEGHDQQVNHEIMKMLQVSDYVSMDFQRNSDRVPVNFYVAYYASQRKGASPHSPRVCIPGGGWEISAIARRSIPVDAEPAEIAFNRVIISKGRSKQLVYYWFQQRGKTIANEYLMKWHLFKDALILNRSDGALVRIVTPMIPGEAEGAADARLQQFVIGVTPVLARYIPD